MANKFVWSGAGGANDGSSWDNAYTTLMRDWGAEAGFTPATDYIYVRSVHSETSGSALTILGSTAEGTTAPCRVVCVVGDTTGTTPGNLATGSDVTTSAVVDINIGEGIYIYGVEFYSGNDIINGFAVGADQDITLEMCRLELTGATAGDTIYIGTTSTSRGGKITWKSVTVAFSAAVQYLTVRGSRFDWYGGTVEFDVDSLVFVPASENAALFTLHAIDFSIGASSSLVTNVGNAGMWTRIIATRCLLGTSATFVNGTPDVPGTRFESYHCQIGTDADPSYQMEIQDARGKIVTDTARYRTGGASDGVRSTPISWDFNTTAGSVRGYPGHALEGPPISAWTDGDGSTAHVYRVAFASDATINDDELWIELEGPNDAATNSLAALKTTRVAPVTTPAAYTTDSGSTWTGSGVTTKQYMEITYTPDKPGPVTVRVMMAKASDNIYVDPKIQIDPA